MANILIVISTAFAAGIWFAGTWMLQLTVLYTAAVVAAIIMVLSVFRRLHYVRIAAAALFFFIGAMHYMHAVAVPCDDISKYAGQTITLQGKVGDVPVVTPGDHGNVRVKYQLSVNKVVGEDGVASARGGMLLHVKQSKDSPVATYDGVLQATGIVNLPHSYNNPGLIDSTASLKREGITARMTVDAGQVVYIDLGSKQSWRQIIAAWRESIFNHFHQTMPAENASILAAMLFGGYQGIKVETLDDFATTGIIHILSVSGTHIALAAGVILWLGGRLGLRSGMMALAAALSILLYSLLSGMTPPVVRSAIMGLAGLAAVGLGRHKDAAAALFLSAFLMLIWQPQLLYDISFQLSFGATAGIVFFYTKSMHNLKFLPAWLAAAFAVTLAAQLGVLPFIAQHFNSFSLSSFIANIVIVPVIEFVVVLGLFAALIGNHFILFTHIILVVCSQLIDAVLKLAAWIASFPAASIYIPSFTILSGSIYYILLAWIYGYKPRSVPGALQCARGWPKLTAFLTGVVVVAVAWHFYYPRPVRVHFIDVGQGDAILVTTPHRRAVLIDAGGTVGDEANFDVGRRVVVPYLKHYGVLYLDYLILSHGHQDHAGGAAAVASAIPVKNIIMSRESFTQGLQALLYRSPDSTVIPVYEEQKIHLDGVDIAALYAPGVTNTKRNNENSSIVRINYGQHSFLLTGDLEAKGEAAAVLSGKDMQSTVLKVGHHGAQTSTTAEFLQAVQPQYAVISVGYNNPFGHPHQQILDRLNTENVRIFRTDRNGAIVFHTDGVSLEVETFL